MGEKSKTTLVYVRFMRPDLVSARLLYIYIYTVCLNVDAFDVFFSLPCTLPLLPFLSLSLSLSPLRQKRTSAHLSLYTPGSFRAQFTFTFVTSLSRLIRFQSFATIFAGCLLKGGARPRLGEGGEKETEPFCPDRSTIPGNFFFFTPFLGNVFRVNTLSIGGGERQMKVDESLINFGQFGKK